MRQITRKRLALAAILLVGLSYATLIQSFSWNQTSHYDLIRSLNVERTTIDQYQQNTGDKAYYRGHFYSARAPGLALMALPFYDTLNLVGAESWTNAHVAPPNHPGDEMIYLIGLWANVLPGLLLLLLVWRVADRFEPGYGAAAAVALGLGTMVLPLSTLLFSHVFTAFLGFGAFALILREREGPTPSAMLLGLAGLAMGYAVASEYPLFFVAAVLGLYLLSRRDALTAPLIARRAGAYIAGGIVGIVPLGLYNHYAFHSWTHLAYSSIPRQQKGFFGISLPSLKVGATLLLDSRGLLTISPVLILGAMGTVLLYKRGKRAEALTIGGICLCYIGYNSGYYLPFGGGFMGPRFLTTMLPFLAFPVAIALKRWPGPTVALAAVSIATTVIATITHPLVGYENETVIWARYLREGFFQPTIASAYGLGRGWGGIWPFLLAAGGAIVLCRVGDAAPAHVERHARLRSARARRLVPVRGAGADGARARSPRPARHPLGGRPHRLEPDPARRQPLPPEDARAARGGRRVAGHVRDATVPQRAGFTRAGCSPTPSPIQWRQLDPLIVSGHRDLEVVEEAGHTEQPEGGTPWLAEPYGGGPPMARTPIGDLQRHLRHAADDKRSSTATVVRGASVRSRPISSATYAPMRTAVAPLSRRHACGASSNPSTTTSTIGRGRTWPPTGLGMARKGNLTAAPGHRGQARPRGPETCCRPAGRAARAIRPAPSAWPPRPVARRPWSPPIRLETSSASPPAHVRRPGATRSARSPRLARRPTDPLQRGRPQETHGVPPQSRVPSARAWPGVR